jgi:hypothetical protein
MFGAASRKTRTKARLAALDRPGDSAAPRRPNPAALSARRGFSSDASVFAHDDVFDPRHSRRFSSPPPRRETLPPAARERSAPPIGHLRTAGDPMVRIHPIAWPAARDLERSPLFREIDGTIAEASTK